MKATNLIERLNEPMHSHDLEPFSASRWPRRLTVVGYLVAAMVVTLRAIHGNLPW